MSSYNLLRLEECTFMPKATTLRPPRKLPDYQCGCGSRLVVISAVLPDRPPRKPPDLRPPAKYPICWCGTVVPSMVSDVLFAGQISASRQTTGFSGHQRSHHILINVCVEMPYCSSVITCKYTDMDMVTVHLILLMI